MITQKDLQKVLTKHPDLSPNGWDGLYPHADDWRLDEIDRALAFIDQCCVSTKNFNHLTGSYGWKHRAERWFAQQGPARPYVCNGAFIVAAIMRGFRVYRDPKDRGRNPNCDFNMKPIHSSRVSLQNKQFVVVNYG